MKKKLLSFAGITAVAIGLSSCAYDPFYGGQGPSRSSVAVGYGHGHGYGGSSFSTSYFWSTGDSRWGYDPYARSYYDFHRRAYYDPYLYGYYPVGYRPPILVGVPHPVGYRHGWCPPPRRITNVTIVNYRNRESAYRNTNHGWARNVRYDGRQRGSAQNSRNLNPYDWGESRRNNAQNRSRFTNAGVTEPRGGLNTRRTSSAQNSNISPRQTRVEESRPRSFGAPATGRQQYDRGGARSQGSPPRVERGGRDAREWNGRGGARTQEAAPRQQLGDGGWAGRQAQRQPSASPRTGREAQAQPSVAPRMGGGRPEGGRRADPAPSENRRNWQNSAAQESVSAPNLGGRGREGMGRSGRR